MQKKNKHIEQKNQLNCDTVSFGANSTGKYDSYEWTFDSTTAFNLKLKDFYDKDKIVIRKKYDISAHNDPPRRFYVSDYKKGEPVDDNAFDTASVIIASKREGVDFMCGNPLQKALEQIEINQQKIEIAPEKREFLKNEIARRQKELESYSDESLLKEKIQAQRAMVEATEEVDRHIKNVEEQISTMKRNEDYYAFSKLA